MPSMPLFRLDSYKYSPDCYLDVYDTPDNGSARPVLIFVHGGTLSRASDRWPYPSDDGIFVR